MAIKPLHNRVLLQRIEAENKTASGIIIPDSAQEKPAEGIVLAVGEGSKDESGKRIALDVKVGDRVLFEKWGATDIKIDGKEALIMEESKIIAIVE